MGRPNWGNDIVEQRLLEGLSTCVTCKLERVARYRLILHISGAAENRSLRENFEGSSRSKQVVEPQLSYAMIRVYDPEDWYMEVTTTIVSE